MYNKVILIGHLGKDPEIRTFDNDNKVANFTMATSETYKNKQGEKITNTEWHNVAVFGGLVGVVEKYMTKGLLVMVEGKIKTRNYDDKDGNKRYVTEIIAENVRMLGKNEESVF